MDQCPMHMNYKDTSPVLNPFPDLFHVSPFPCQKSGTFMSIYDKTVMQAEVYFETSQCLAQREFSLVLLN